MAFKSCHTVNGRIRGETDVSGLQRDYLTDAVGSVTATVDQSGAVENTYRYKPYGERLAKTGTGADPRFLWTGETGSRTTGAAHAGQYNRARHLDTETGTWTSVDPLWPEEQAYVYVGGNPTTWTDPNGTTIRVQGCKCERCIPGTRDKEPVKDPLLPAAQRACDKLRKCMSDPKCKAKMVDCVSKHASSALYILECMAKKCGPRNHDITLYCGGPSCNGVCGFMAWWDHDDIHVCFTRTEELCRRPEYCRIVNPVIARCDKPACNLEFGLDLEQSILHELSHTCGTSDANDQADEVANCIW